MCHAGGFQRSRAESCLQQLWGSWTGRRSSSVRPHRSHGTVEHVGDNGSRLLAQVEVRYLSKDAATSLADRY